MCREREIESVYVERQRKSVCRDKERDGRESTTIRMWFRMRARARVIWHFVHARFLAFCPLAFCPDTVKLFALSFKVKKNLG